MMSPKPCHLHQLLATCTDMSERQQLAQRIADFISRNRLTVPYGGDVSKAGRHYTVTFASPKTLDGVVNVYGDKFIQITYQTAYRELPHRDNRVFESESDAVSFLNLAFVRGDYQAALAIPTRVRA